MSAARLLPSMAARAIGVDVMSSPSATSVERFRSDLEQVIAKDADVIVLHSGLFGFANRLDVPPRDIPGLVLDIVDDIVGPDRTLVMPTFFFGFPRERKYDDVLTRPDTGAIAQLFMNRPTSTRSAQPMNSYAVEGPRADELLSRPCTTAWGKDGVMAWFYDVDACYVTLGVGTLLSNSYYHMAEQWEGVPYRYFKRFVGERFHDGEPAGECSEVMYVRPLGYTFDFLGVPVDELMGARGLKTRPERDDGVIMESMSMRDIIHTSQEILRDNIYAMVTEPYRDGLKKWIAEGHLEAEEAAVPEHQRYTPSVA